ncbi:DedA family protein [uncultured Cytophaga sp.]|uniref:DedA family protein n=1 Tax=uncultured Cytophaga sp. TaxID=160238 RepID=UPI0026293385|nr:DedA family protein [uncultured Cytophaga sp.]
MVEFFKLLADWFLHLDSYLEVMVDSYGPWIYVILFLVIFAETGLVVLPFLPGDSLLFATGMLAAKYGMNPWLLILVLVVAAILGDTVNYHIGKFIGPKVFRADAPKNFFLKLLKKEYLEQGQAFYEKHGGKTIIIARFVPIVRTFAPFVAGVSTMNYSKFITFNIIGGVVWVAGLLLAGYYLASIPFVHDHFEHMVLAIIFISIIPIIIELVRAKMSKK